VPTHPDNYVAICNIRALSKTVIRATGHVDDEISVLLIIKYIFTTFVALTCPHGERVDCTLRQEPNAIENEGLTGIHVFLLLKQFLKRMYKCILFLMIPFHMPMISFYHEQMVHLFIKDWIPPHIQYSASKLTPSYEKTAQIESAAILRNKDIHRLRLIDVCNIRYVKWVVGLGDISISDLVKMRENLSIQRTRRLHDVRMLTE